MNFHHKIFCRVGIRESAYKKNKPGFVCHYSEVEFRAPAHYPSAVVVHHPQKDQDVKQQRHQASLLIRQFQP